MNYKHIIKFFIWSRIVAMLFWFYQDLAEEYSDYCQRAWQAGQAAMDRGEWVSRKLFPRRYWYEYHCPDCGGFTTSYGLCVECGKRHGDFPEQARPM